MLRKLLVTILIPLSAFAQSDDKSAAILKAVSETNSAYKDIQVTFSYTRIMTHLIGNGEVFRNQRNGFRR